MCHPSNGKAYPYIVGTMTEKHLTLDLFEGIYDKVPEDMGKGYTVDRQQVADKNLTYRACTLEAVESFEYILTSAELKPIISVTQDRVASTSHNFSIILCRKKPKLPTSPGHCW
jgi:hypothetical protein